MPWFHVIWDDGEDGNIAHIAEHNVTPEEVMHVLHHGSVRGVSATTGRPRVEGATPAGRWLVVIYEQIDAVTVMPVTAYEPESIHD